MAGIGMNPDVFARQFATQNNISLSEAREQLRAKYGDPTQGGQNANQSIFSQAGYNVGDTNSVNNIFSGVNGLDSTSTSTSTNGLNFADYSNVEQSQNGNMVPPEEALKLMELGIPMETIMKGDDAIKTYAEENDIQLPEKKQMDFMA